MEEKTLIVKKQSHLQTYNHHHEIEFVDPVYRDDEFVVVEKNANDWFMVVFLTIRYYYIEYNFLYLF